MIRLVSRPEYEEMTAATRDRRMAWWREARFGMFVHFGLYSTLGRHEWAMAEENWPVEEYEKLAGRFKPEAGAPRAWARLAKAAGMKYMVLTTRHHEGFSLWDSQANPYNSVNYGPRRDIVREYVDACREYGLRVGFYSSLMDWHHPDGATAAYDSAARKRFTDYIYALNEELLTNYGKIDILWYDVSRPMESFEGWNSLEMNQRLRALQPDIIINNRSKLNEDFGTPEERITAEQDRDWESCMTYNGISWGYVDSSQVGPYSYNAPQILKMLARCTGGGGNLLLNIGPAPDGSVPSEAVGPLGAVGKWLEKNGECAYGKIIRNKSWGVGNGLCSLTRKGNTAYLWNWIWPPDDELIAAGFVSKLKSARILGTEQELPFEQEKYRIILRNLPRDSRDTTMGVTVFALEFDEEPETVGFAVTPHMNVGRIYT
ncbi:MAG: alpha-L-fucosidase [Treponema sp.]|jgi:alpha-L-fucosidase|nr:alpha-L-fucosidase [Treponema sp.]